MTIKKRIAKAILFLLGDFLIFSITVLPDLLLLNLMDTKDVFSTLKSFREPGLQEAMRNHGKVISAVKGENTTLPRRRL